MWEDGLLISGEFSDKLKLENNVKSKFCIKWDLYLFIFISSDSSELKISQTSHLLYEIISDPSVNLDMINISHAKKAQDLATETNYRTFLHEYTTLPTDMSVAWAKKAYGLQSDVSFTKQVVMMCFMQSK